MPGCYHENNNGIYLPYQISNPIKEVNISDEWVLGWEQALENLRERIRQNVVVLEPQTKDDSAMNMTVLEAGTLQDNVS